MQTRGTTHLRCAIVLVWALVNVAEREAELKIRRHLGLNFSLWLGKLLNLSEFQFAHL